jgi:hypothetical protein
MSVITVLERQWVQRNSRQVFFFCRRRYRWPLFSVIADASSKYFSLN